MLGLFMLSIDDFLPSEKRCAEVLREFRWRDGVECVWCGSRDVVKNGSYMQHYQKYMCRGCGRSFNDKTGTIFEYSKMGVREWLYIARELQKNKSINKISKELGRRYKHVMRIAHMIMERVKTRKFLEKLSGVVEMDEMYVSAGQKGTRCVSRRPRRRGLKLRGRGTWEKDKPPIMALLERGGKVVLKVAKHVSKKTVDGLMELVGRGSVINTDDFTAYMHLREEDWDHRVVNHSMGEYARDDVHTNTVEGLFQGLRHWLNTSKGVCKKNLQLFVSMFQFNYNHKNLNPMDKFTELLHTILYTPSVT